MHGGTVSAYLAIRGAILRHDKEVGMTTVTKQELNYWSRIEKKHDFCSLDGTASYRAVICARDIRAQIAEGDPKLIPAIRKFTTAKQFLECQRFSINGGPESTMWDVFSRLEPEPAN